MTLLSRYDNLGKNLSELRLFKLFPAKFALSFAIMNFLQPFIFNLLAIRLAITSNCNFSEHLPVFIY